MQWRVKTTEGAFGEPSPFMSASAPPIAPFPAPALAPVLTPAFSIHSFNITLITNVIVCNIKENLPTALSLLFLGSELQVLLQRFHQF